MSPTPSHTAALSAADLSLQGAGALALRVDPAGDGAAAALADALAADPAVAAVLVEACAECVPVATVEQAVRHAGLPRARALAIAASLPAHAPAAQSAVWSGALAQACAALLIGERLSVDAPLDAFALGLLSAVDGVAAVPWSLPDTLARAHAGTAQHEDCFRLDEADWVALARVQTQAALVAAALTDVPRDGAAGARTSGGLEALRVLLELDRAGFVALYERTAAAWRRWSALLGLPVREAPALASIHRAAGALAADDEIARALDPATSPALEALSVLAVDDEPASLRTLERALRRAGHEVVTASDGFEALRLALEVHPQALVADWMMPGMDGLELCRALRRSEHGRNIFFLLLTGRGEEDRVVEAFDAGVDDYVTKPFNARVLAARLRAGQRVIDLQRRFESNRRLVLRQVAEMGLLARKLRTAALTDALTDLPNRRQAMGRLEAEWEAASATGRPLSVVLLDIDHFKDVNDRYGHDVGDLVLRELAGVLRRTTRLAEEASRLGGEEFLVVCPNTTEEQACAAAERLRAAIEANLIRGLGFHGHVTVSAGVAQRTPGMTDHEALIKAADLSVYAAKASGRNQVARASALPPDAADALRGAG